MRKDWETGPSFNFKNMRLHLTYYISGSMVNRSNCMGGSHNEMLFNWNGDFEGSDFFPVKDNIQGFRVKML